MLWPPKPSKRVEAQRPAPRAGGNIPCPLPTPLSAPSRGDRNIAWIEAHCFIPEGRYVGKPVRLTPRQQQWIHRIYDSPTRMFILSMGRKGAKTAFAAFLLLLHLCGPEARVNSHLFSAAQSREQAAILFGLAAKIVRLSSTLRAFVSIRDTAKQLHCPELGTLYRALSAEVTTSFGLSPAFTVHDELGQVRGPRSELYEALETAAAAQDDPLSLVISTQAPTDNDLLSLLIDDAKTGADPRIKLELYTAPVDRDPFEEDTIRLANPHYDIFMNKEEVLRQAQSAQRMPSRESSYRNLILNQRVEARDPFVAPLVWRANRGTPVTDLTGLDVYGALDLSSVSDLTACVWVTQPHGPNWHVVPQFWLPEDGIAEKSKKDHVPYDIWAKQGHLTLTPGASIQFSFVAAYLRQVFDLCNVKAVAFDRYYMRFLIPYLREEGFTEEELERFVEFGQGFASMAPALRETESLLLQGQLEHGEHPVLTMCAMNAVVVKDPSGNSKFAKNKASGRIDGMVALAMAVATACQPAEEEASLDEYLAAPIVASVR